MENILVFLRVTKQEIVLVSFSVCICVYKCECMLLTEYMYIFYSFCVSAFIFVLLSTYMFISLYESGSEQHFFPMEEFLSISVCLYMCVCFFGVLSE